ncbi:MULTISPECIES: hypothetical protein [Natronorubrum]|uniref:Uncharacterized protein n=2 Tax=Natronorubrum bangense TaxID=61858 RepID=L9WMM9_9EURY|nr:hypothetical protein [Natronorubrum bangense]ELY50642.1 hypothetical protein C494_04665 [Natronorubrum bangense JCM 10635]QCC54459.1 hypothetical protein DV706_08140 [Natronorubrum bangense]
MLESVPAPIEAAIYLYFVVVAAIGCYLHGRLWLTHRSQHRSSESDQPATHTDDGSQTDG